MRAVGAHKAVILAALDAADGQLVLVAELQAEFLGEVLNRNPGRSRLRLFRGRQLAEHLRQRHGRIGGSGPLRLEILLIRHGR